jgi:hypothetical protein
MIDLSSWHCYRQLKVRPPIPKSLIFPQGFANGPNFNHIVTVPTRDLTESAGTGSGGAFDILGNRYVIPIYCMTLPTNLAHTSSAIPRLLENETMNPNTSIQGLSGAKVKVRLSSGEDRTIYAHTVDSLRETVKNDLNLATANVRVMHLGRELQGDATLKDMSDSIVQVFIIDTPMP